MCSNAEINANFHFSHCKSMETLRCHSNKSTWAMIIKNIIYDNKKHNLCRGLCHEHVCKASPSSPLRLLRRIFFNSFSKIYPLRCHGNQSNSAISTKFIWIIEEHFSKNLNICSETAKIANFHFSHYKSMENINCHSNQSSYPIGTKNIINCSPIYRCYMWNMERIGFRGVVIWKCWWMDDGCLPILQALLCAFGSGELKTLWSPILYTFLCFIICI